MVKVEVRADGTAQIEGYVNVVERESKPILTPHGMVNEQIESGVFQRAIDSAKNINMTIDHTEKVVASTKKQTLKLYEDAIGLRAFSEITDPETVQAAKDGRIKGWSFGMKNVEDNLEERADKLPLRHVTGFALDHVSLLIDKVPAYAATSAELRAGNETMMEERSMDTEISVIQPKKEIDYTEYEQRMKQIKGEQ